MGALLALSVGQAAQLTGNLAGDSSKNYVHHASRVKSCNGFQGWSFVATTIAIDLASPMALPTCPQQPAHRNLHSVPPRSGGGDLLISLNVESAAAIVSGVVAPFANVSQGEKLGSLGCPVDRPARNVGSQVKMPAESPFGHNLNSFCAPLQNASSRMQLGVVDNVNSNPSVSPALAELAGPVGKEPVGGNVGPESAPSMEQDLSQVSRVLVDDLHQFVDEVQVGRAIDTIRCDRLQKNVC